MTTDAVQAWLKANPNAREKLREAERLLHAVDTALAPDAPFVLGAHPDGTRPPTPNAELVFARWRVKHIREELSKFLYGDGTVETRL